MTALVKRNLKLYFRDRASVLFSLLAVFIIIGLYALFLRDNLIQNYKELPGAEKLVDLWTVAGILCVSAVTTTLGSFGVMVDDRVRGMRRDFNASPLPRWKITGAYLASSSIIGVIMTVLTLVIAEIYLYSTGSGLLEWMELFKALGLILLTVLTSSAIISFLVSFFSSSNAFGSASTIIGTLIGFLTGVYFPIGILPSAVQSIVRCFPISHATALMRQILCDRALAETFAGAPDAMRQEFETLMGVTFSFGDIVFPVYGYLLVLAATALVFFLLALWNMTRKRKEG